MGTRELTDEALAREFQTLFGFRRAVVLMGWCALLVVYGVKDRQGMIEAKIGGRTTRYRVLADLQMLRDHLEREGYDMSTVVGSGDLDEMAATAGLVARATV